MLLTFSLAEHADSAIEHAVQDLGQALGFGIAMAERLNGGGGTLGSGLELAVAVGHRPCQT